MGPLRRVAPGSRRMTRLIVVSVSPVTKADGMGFGRSTERSQGSAPRLARRARVPATGIAHDRGALRGGPQDGPPVRPGSGAAAHRRGRGPRRRADRCGDRGGAPERTPARPDRLLRIEDQITAWVADGGNNPPLTITKIETRWPGRAAWRKYRTLHRFATERCGFGRKDTTVRIVDGDPGSECQIDFGYLGYLTDPETGRRRKVHALIFTAVYSRHMFVWLTYSQTLAAVIAGCEAAWTFFGGVFKVLIPGNLKAVVTEADAVNPRLSQGWLDYAQHTGFVTDPARIRSPENRPRVERAVQYVRGNYWAGEDFTDLAEAQRRAEVWCRDTAGMRTHGSTAARPLEVFDEDEAPILLAVPQVYDVPIFKQVKVHRDFHAEVAKALYSIPGQWIGSTLEVRADSALVKFYLRGTLVKVHPQPAGGDAPTRRIRPPRRSDMRCLTGTGSLTPAPGTSAPRDLRTERQQPRRWDRGPRELGICRCWSIACRSSSRYSTRRAPANAKMSRRVVDSE